MAAPRSQSHRVRPSDAIARRYGVPASVIMQANNIASPAIIYPANDGNSALTARRRLQLRRRPQSSGFASDCTRSCPASVAAATPASNAASMWSQPAIR